MSCDNATALTTQEAKDLKKLEHRIQAGIQVFHTVGRALAEISERKLYRAKYATFQDYCRERWGFGRAHAYRLIGAAQVIENVSPAGDIGGVPESTIRPLTKLGPADQRAAWEAATADGHDPDAEELNALTDEFLDAPDAQAKLDAAEKFREKLRKRSERQDKDAVVDEEKRRRRRALDHCRLARKELRGVVGGEEDIGHLEAVMRSQCDQLGIDYDAQGLKAA